MTVARQPSTAPKGAEVVEDEEAGYRPVEAQGHPYLPRL